MKICYQTSNLFGRFDWDTAVRWLSEAGFDALDYSMFTPNCLPHENDDPEKHAEKVLPIVQKYGLHFHQAHAPFPSNIPGNEEYNRRTLAGIRKSLEVAGFLGVSQVVVHPFKTPAGESREAVKEANARFYGSLAETAQKAGVRVAVENVWDWNDYSKVDRKMIPIGCADAEEMAELIDRLGTELFTVCLDIGHCGLVGFRAEDAIRTLGHKRLGALHVHDNDGRSDLHCLPYTVGCCIDWQAVTDALGAIDYAGYFTLEADAFISQGTPDTIPVMLEYSAKLARVLADRAEAARQTNGQS